jgi:HSP20 family protein
VAGVKQKPMTLVKYNRAPVSTASPVDRLASEIFGSNIARLFGNDGLLDHGPRVNIVENVEEYRLEMQAPGFDKKDLKVEMVDDTLTIRGEHTEDERKEETRWTRREFSRTAFERSFVLPQSVKADAIKADYVNGVLQLSIPKSEEAKPKTRTISIQ